MNTLSSNPRSIENLLSKYGQSNLPRHTSYPAANLWQDITSQFAEQAWLEFFSEPQPISLYVHVPFCQSLCYYCGCNKEVIGPLSPANEDRISTYVDELATELRMLARLAATSGQLHRIPIQQLHFGGGTPNYLPEWAWRRILLEISNFGKLSTDAEFAVEIDPRLASQKTLELLKELGCNRLSMGIQEFDPEVQRVIHRHQPLSLVKQCIDEVHRLGFPSVNFDLIYGLPRQTLEGFTQTLRETLELGPERISLFRLAVMPHMFKWQKTFKPEDLPSQADCLKMFQTAIEMLRAHGYIYVGLDHFAKADDPLAKALEQGTLRRNFQGMAPDRELPIVGIGPSAISQFGPYYLQNHKSMKHWSEALNLGQLPQERGWQLHPEDIARRELIQRIYCQGEIHLARHLQSIADNSQEQAIRTRLQELVEEGILSAPDGDQTYHLTDPLGRILARVVAAIFDPYVKSEQWRGEGAKLASQVL